MADNQRYRRGPTTLIQVPVASSTVINKGDLISLSDGKAVPLDNTYDTSSAAAAIKEAASDAFVGVAHSASANGDTDDVLVDISLESIYEFPQQAAAAISVGDLLTVYAANSGDNMDGQLITSDTGSWAMFTCVREHSSAAGVNTLIKMTPQKLFNPAPEGNVRDAQIT
jgi:hypothetical protein